MLQADDEISLMAGTRVTSSAPDIELDGTVTQGEGPQGGDASMAGPLTVRQDVTAVGTSPHGHRDSQWRHNQSATPVRSRLQVVVDQIATIDRVGVSRYLLVCSLSTGAARTPCHRWKGGT